MQGPRYMLVSASSHPGRFCFSFLGAFEQARWTLLFPQPRKKKRERGWNGKRGGDKERKAMPAPRVGRSGMSVPVGGPRVPEVSPVDLGIWVPASSVLGQSGGGGGSEKVLNLPPLSRVEILILPCGTQGPALRLVQPLPAKLSFLLLLADVVKSCSSRDTPGVWCVD